MSKNWLLSFIFGKSEDTTQEKFTTREDKVPGFLKTSAYEFGELLEETIQKDYLRLISGISNFVLAEKITELELQGKNLSEKYAEYFREVLGEVQKNRKKAETRLYKLIPRHSQLDSDGFFKRIKELNEKEVEAKNRAVKKKASDTKWQEGDVLTAKEDNDVCAVVTYVNTDNGTYTILLDGTTAPTYYPFTDAHNTFEKTKEPRKSESSYHPTFILESQDEKGFWNEVRRSYFIPELNIKAELMKEENSDINLRLVIAEEVEAPKFTEGQEIHPLTQPQALHKVLSVDTVHGIYTLTAPGFKAPIRYTFEKAHKYFDTGGSHFPQGGGGLPGEHAEKAPALPSEKELPLRAQKEQLLEEVNKSLTRIQKRIESPDDEGVESETKKQMVKDTIDAKKALEETRNLLTEQISGKHYTEEIERLKKDIEKNPALKEYIVDIQNAIKLLEEEAKEMAFTSKQIDGLNIILQGKAILNTDPQKRFVIFNTSEKATEAFNKISSIEDFNKLMEVPDFLEVEGGAPLPFDQFLNVIDEARTNRLSSEQLRQKHPELTEAQVKSIMEKAQVTPPGSTPEGSEGNAGMGVAPIGGTGVFVEPSRGGDATQASVDKVIEKKADTEDSDLRMEKLEEARQEAASIKQEQFEESVEEDVRDIIAEKIDEEGGAEEIVKDAKKALNLLDVAPKTTEEATKLNNQIIDWVLDKVANKEESKGPGLPSGYYLEVVVRHGRDPQEEATEKYTNESLMKDIIEVQLEEELFLVGENFYQPIVPEASLEEGNTFELGEKAILNSKVGALEEGSEVIILGLQNTSVIFESISNRAIKGFTKFSKLDKIVKEKYQWDNDGLDVKLELGDTVRIGTVNVCGEDLKGKVGKIVENIFMPLPCGEVEVYYKVELEGSHPVMLPGDALTRVKAAKKASLVGSEIEATIEKVVAKIVHEKGKWTVKSETSGRNMGTYDTKEAAEKRLKQIEMFKHMKGKKKATKVEEVEVKLKYYSAEEIAKKHDISADEVNKLLDEGAKIEGEHTSDKDVAQKIASAHLMEKPDYYKLLEKVEKKAVLKPNLDVVNDFLDSFKIPPTVVSDVMVQEFLQQKNLMATKEDLKEIYKLLQNNRVEVRLTPEREAPTASLKIAEEVVPESTIGPETAQSVSGISVGDHVKYIVTADEVPGKKAGEEATGLVVLMPVQMPTEGVDKPIATANVIWDHDKSITHGLSPESLNKIAAKYRTETTSPGGSKTIVEKELDIDAPEIKIKNPDGSESTFKKV